ncbi:MAG: cobalamin biosynthesis protein CbiG, partial [Pseudomonadota bacterium]
MDYDAYAMVDWSAASKPVTGKDSIWVAEKASRDGTIQTTNFATRIEAIAWLRSFAERIAGRGERALVGYDFAFGYPAGAAQLMVGSDDWREVWAFMGAQFKDDASNANARFHVADRLNADAFSKQTTGPFWGHPVGQSFTALSPKKPSFHGVCEHRIVEGRVPSAKSVWQMCYAGAVGGQTMTGIAALQACRLSHPDCFSIWPFETGFSSDKAKPVTLCEVYPSLLEVLPATGEVKDAAQVRTLVEHVAASDARGALDSWLGTPDGLSEKELQAVLCEEGWI